MEYKIESTTSLKEAQKLIDYYSQKNWELHTFTTNYEGRNYVMVFEK